MWTCGYLVDAVERIGLRLGVAPFVVDALKLGLGLFLPDLISSVYAALAGTSEKEAATSAQAASFSKLHAA